MSNEASVTDKQGPFRTAKLFRNGQNQAVRLPREFEMKAGEVIIRKQGNSLILTPRPVTWQDYFASAQLLDSDFPEDINELPFETREDL